MTDTTHLTKLAVDNTLSVAGATTMAGALAVTGATTLTGGVTGNVIPLTGGTLFPQVSPKATVSAKTADYTLVAGDLGKIMTNTGASGTVVFTLPDVAASIGKVIGFKVLAAQIIRVLPVATVKLYLDGDGVASKYLNLPATIGTYAEVYSDGTDWIVTKSNGVLTKEA